MNSTRHAHSAPRGGRGKLLMWVLIAMAMAAALAAALLTSSASESTSTTTQVEGASTDPATISEYRQELPDQSEAPTVVLLCKLDDDTCKRTAYDVHLMPECELDDTCVVKEPLPMPLCKEDDDACGDPLVRHDPYIRPSDCKPADTDCGFVREPLRSEDQ